MSTRTQPGTQPGTQPPLLVWGLSRGQVRSRTSEQMPLRWMFSAAGSEQRESGLPKEEGLPATGRARRALVTPRAGGPGSWLVFYLITGRALCQGLCEPISLTGNGGLGSTGPARGRAARKRSASQTRACATPKRMFLLHRTRRGPTLSAGLRPGEGRRLGQGLGVFEPGKS